MAAKVSDLNRQYRVIVTEYLCLESHIFGDGENAVISFLGILTYLSSLSRVVPIEECCIVYHTLDLISEFSRI